jgi:hypothetical protein
MKVFDDGKTIDRYTLITDNNEMYGFSEYPYEPNGFGQYCGEWTGGDDYSNLGKEIELRELSVQAYAYVYEKILDEMEGVNEQHTV